MASGQQDCQQVVFVSAESAVFRERRGGAPVEARPGTDGDGESLVSMGTGATAPGAPGIDIVVTHFEARPHLDPW